jgi:hypothetical protein
VAAHDDQSGHDTADEAAVPGETHPSQVMQIEIRQLLEQVVDLGADEAPDGRLHHK